MMRMGADHHTIWKRLIKILTIVNFGLPKNEILIPILISQSNTMIYKLILILMSIKNLNVTGHTSLLV